MYLLSGNSNFMYLPFSWNFIPFELFCCWNFGPKLKIKLSRTIIQYAKDSRQNTSNQIVQHKVYKKIWGTKLLKSYSQFPATCILYEPVVLNLVVNDIKMTKTIECSI